jgi:hypothetical protein
MLYQVLNKVVSARSARNDSTLRFFSTPTYLQGVHPIGVTL